MFNGRWILDSASVPIISEIYNVPNLILSTAHVDGRWPLEFAFFYLLVASANYGGSRWPRC